MQQPSRVLLILGTVLFLLGLLNGAAVQSFLNPRMGLSAHLAAVQSALVLWALGLMWPALRLGPRARAVAAGSAAFGMYALWGALALAAMTGSSRDLPIAGRGYSASALADTAVAVFLYAGSLSSVVATVLILVGLAKHPSRA